MEIDLSDLHNRRRKGIGDLFTSLVAWLVVVLLCLIAVGGLAWVAQVVWRSVLA